jgi:lipopolysaccharide/colanic/teichoic acid biosynthesis glycosyltransferase
MGKRIFDVLLSGLALIVLSPVFLAIVLVLRFTGEGEIFYRQERTGKGGRPFGMLKFTTMVKGSPNMGTGLLTVKDDPRILPVGRFLRKTKLNELPQLWNVLVGDMSIIGPRPQAEPHFRLYSRQVQRELATVRPGLSGIGSIVFRDEEDVLAAAGKDVQETYSKDIADYKGRLEVWYVRNRTFWMDLLLIFLTIWVVLVPAGSAYRRFLPGLPQNTNPDLRLQ